MTWRTPRWLLPLALLCVCAACGAQTGAQTGQLSDDVKDRLMDLTRHERVRQGLAELAVAARTSPDDPFIRYIRGYLLGYAGDYDTARQLLAPLGDYKPNDRFLTGVETLKAIDDALRLRPVHTIEVKDGGDVAFKVYFDDDDEWTRKYVAALTTVFKSASRVFGMACRDRPCLHLRKP